MEGNDSQINTNLNVNNIRSEKIITRKGIIITCILLFFVSIFLDLYFILLTDLILVMKIILCIIHPLLFIIFLFIPSGLYIEFNYSQNKFIFYKTCIIPYLWKRYTKNEIDIDTIETFKIDTSKFLFFRMFNLYYEGKNGNTIKITSGRDKNCVSNFTKGVLNIPIKLNFWLKNQDFFEQSILNEEKPIDNN